MALTGSTIASTYLKLLRANSDTMGADATASYIQDSADTDSVLSISTTRVGIGNTAPTALLTAGAITTLVTDGTTAVTPEGVNLHITEASKYAMGIKNADASGDGLIIQAGDAADDFALRVEDYDSANDLLVVQGGGAVGIGTASPDFLLELESSTGSKINIKNTGSGQTELLGNRGTASDGQGLLVLKGTWDGNNVASIEMQAGDDTTNKDNGQIAFQTSTASSSPATRMTINESGNVGIGTASPASLLETSKGNVTGLGTFADSHINLNNTTDVNSTSLITFGYPTGKTNASAYIGYICTAGGAAGKGDIIIGARDATSDSASTERMRITSAGKVGIGDTSPDAHLDVEDLTLDTNTHYTSFLSNVKKTLGASTNSHSFIGIQQNFDWDDDDASSLNSYFDTLMGIRNDVTVTDSAGASVGLMGYYSNTQLVAGNPNNVYGAHIITDMDGGTVDESIHGCLIDLDVESGGTISDNAKCLALKMDMDTDPTNVAVMMDLYALTNIDAYIYCYGGVGGNDINFKVDTSGNIYTDGNHDAGAATDYAEYFESTDGSVIPIGNSVTLENGKIKQAEEVDTIIGVVRPHDGVIVGGSQWSKWKDKHLKDDYGKHIFENYTHTKWSEEITFEEYIARGKDETGGSEGGICTDSKVEGSKAIPAKEAVTQQKTVDKEVEEEVTTTELVDGKYVQKTETVTKTVKVPQYDEEDLYDEDGEVIGKHQVPIMETVEEAVAAVDAVAETYFREHKYHSDRIPEGVTVPDDAEVIEVAMQRKKLNPDYDESKTYVPREERDEWHVVGILGQVPITKGQPLADNWIKMKDISDTVEMYFVK